MEEKKEEKATQAPLEINDDIPIQDCKTPACIAHQLSNTIMLAKAHTSFIKLFILGFLAGVYIGFGGEIATLVLQDAGGAIGTGLLKVISGGVFTVALILIIIAGGELFTGNTLILLSVLEKRTTISLLFRNWFIVYLANFSGTIFIVLLLYFTGLWEQNNFHASVASLKIAALKVNLSFIEAFTRGILANWLVCLAIWMSVASRLVIGKIMVIFFPILTFAAVSFEHCIANMYFVPKGLILKNIPEVVQAAHIPAEKLANLTIPGFIINNLIPVTLGNIFGAIIFVALLYWFVFLKDKTGEQHCK